MAETDTSRERDNDCTLVEGDSHPAKDCITPAFDGSLTRATKWRVLEAVIVTLAVLVSSSLALHLFLHNYPELQQEFQARSRWLQTRPGMEYDADGHPACQHYHVHNSSVSPRDNAALARRQEKNKYTFYIPITSKTYKFTSWGSIDKSMIKVVPFESDMKWIKVDVEVTKDPRNLAKVFKLPVLKVPILNSQVNGVGFWARPVFNRKDWPAFSVTVQIPSTSGQQQRLGNFETRLSNFDHELKDLYTPFMFTQLYTSTTNSKMKFEKVAAKAMVVYNTNGPVKLDTAVATNMWVRSTNGAIKLDKIKATVGHLKTTNGEISGKAWSDKEMSLGTTNNKVSAECTLTKSGTIKLSTTNGKLSGDIKLQSKDADEGPARPNYRIVASNDNQPIRLKVSEQPTGSGCWVSAWGSSAVKVEMPPAYEGKFRFHTVQNRGKVEKKGSDDPAGRGRQRFVAYDKPKSTSSGRTGWGSADDKESHAPGEVRVITRRGPAEIIFN